LRTLYAFDPLRAAMKPEARCPDGAVKISNFADLDTTPI